MGVVDRELCASVCVNHKLEVHIVPYRSLQLSIESLRVAE